jgi:hypothetical protein
MSECNCRVCSNHRRWMAAIDPQTQNAKAALDEIFGNLEGAETDAVYWRMKFQGTWGQPSAAGVGGDDPANRSMTARPANQESPGQEPPEGLWEMVQCPKCGELVHPENIGFHCRNLCQLPRSVASAEVKDG